MTMRDPSEPTVEYEEMEELREKLGWTQKQVTEALDFSPGAYRRWGQLGRVKERHLNRIKDFLPPKPDRTPDRTPKLLNLSYKLTDPADTFLLMCERLIPPNWEIAVLIRDGDSVTFTKVR